MISIEFNTKDMERILSPLSGLPKAITMAMKLAARRTGQTLRSDIRKGVKAESYLRGGDIGKAFGILEVKEAGTAVTASFRVAGGWLPADHFKLIPNRVTARKRICSIHWPSAAFQIGPSEPVSRPESGNGLSKAFVIRLHGKKLMFQRYGKKRGALERVPGYSVQYFSVFDRVQQPAMERARSTFAKRLEHEVERVIGRLK